MTKLESFIERLRALPESEQNALIEEIEFMLEGQAPTLTDEQWAEIERRKGEDTVPHAEVVASMRAKFGD